MIRCSATALLLLLSFGIVAQPRFGERIDVKLIEIDVVVTDADGNRIYGLTADDFEVFEGRARQDITNFTEYRGIGGNSTGDESYTQPILEPHTLLVMIDWLPREGFVRSSVFASLDALLTKLMRGGDRLGLVFWAPGLERATTIIEPSSNREAVTSAIRALAGTTNATANAAAGSTDAIEQFLEEAARASKGKGADFDLPGHKATSDRVAAEMQLLQFRRKTAAMTKLVASLAAGPGKKSFLYVSHSFALPASPGTRLTALGMLEELTKAANAAGVTFYAVRPATSDAEDGGPLDLDRHLDALTRLTKPTGGLLDFGLRSVATLGVRIAEDRDSYYSIAYRARSDGRDRERRILVRAKSSPYHVRARKSVVEKSNETIAREMLMARLFGADGGNDLDFTIEQGAPRGASRGRWLIPLVLKIPADQLQFAQDGRDQVALLKILIVAGNGISEVTNVNEDDLRVVAGKQTRGGVVKYSVELLADRRGSQVSIGVFDRRTGLLGTRTIDNRNRFR